MTNWDKIILARKLIDVRPYAVLSNRTGSALMGATVHWRTANDLVARMPNTYEIYTAPHSRQPLIRNIKQRPGPEDRLLDWPITLNNAARCDCCGDELEVVCDAITTSSRARCGYSFGSPSQSRELLDAIRNHVAAVKHKED